MKKNKTDTLLDSFEPGDLLYGLENEARKYYRAALQDKLSSIKAKHPHLITVDEYNNPLSEPLFSSNDYRMSPLKQLPSPIKSYGKALLSSEKFKPALAQNLPTPKRFDGKILLSCQFAIFHCEGTIHFCLDGLELDKSRNPDSGEYFNSFTAQELRFIADNFEDLKDKVKFYLGGYKVLSPWEEEKKDPKSWLNSYQKADKEYKENAKLDANNKLTAKMLDFLSESPQSRRGFQFIPEKPLRSQKRELVFPPQRNNDEPLVARVDPVFLRGRASLTESESADDVNDNQAFSIKRR